MCMGGGGCLFTRTISAAARAAERATPLGSLASLNVPLKDSNSGSSTSAASTCIRQTIPWHQSLHMARQDEGRCEAPVKQVPAGIIMGGGAGVKVELRVGTARWELGGGWGWA